MTLFLGLEWFSIALYVLCAIDIDLVGSLEAGLKYLVIGAVGSATLLFGSALVYGATGELSLRQDRDRRASPHDSLLVLGLAMMHRRVRVQGLGRAVPHVDARRLPGRPDAGDGVHVVGDEGGGARRDASACSSPRSRGEAHLWTWAVAGIAIFSLAIGNIAALAQRNVKRLLAYSSVSHAGFMLIAVAAANRDRRAGAHVLPDPLLRDVARRVRRVAARERELGTPVTLENLVRLRLGAAVLRRLDVGVHARLPRASRSPAASGGRSTSSRPPTTTAGGG